MSEGAKFDGLHGEIKQKKSGEDRSLRRGQERRRHDVVSRVFRMAFDGVVERTADPELLDEIKNLSRNSEFKLEMHKFLDAKTLEEERLQADEKNQIDFGSAESSEKRWALDVAGKILEHINTGVWQRVTQKTLEVLSSRAVWKDNREFIEKAKKRLEDTDFRKEIEVAWKEASEGKEVKKQEKVFMDLAIASLEGEFFNQ